MTLIEIQQQIDAADIAYYSTGTSLLEDAAYDLLKEELKKLAPQDVRLTRVGASVRESILEKRTHSIKMGSLDKATSKAEFKKWLENNSIGLDEVLFASYKADGGSYSFEYQNGRLIYAVSRGDGSEGEDITANALHFKKLPKHITLARIPFTGFIRGEVILDNDSWEIADPDLLTNPRNTGCGIAARKDGKDANLLRVLAFRAYDSTGQLLGHTEEDQQQILTQMGFETIPSTIGPFSKIWEFYEKTNSDRKLLDYWIDGIVVKINNLDTQTQLGETSHHPKGQIALKFPAEIQTSILRGITFQVGQTGAICPVGNFDTVSLGGAAVCNATLHNWDYIRMLDVAIGDTIEVIKAGDIIPKILKAPIKGKNRVVIDEPTHCPECHSPVIRKQNVSGTSSAAIYCSNANCSSKQSGKIFKFVKSLSIMGAGESVIQALIDHKFISDAADLFTLKLHENSLPGMTFESGVRFGDKRTQNLLDELEAKRELELSEFLGALGIPGLGRRRVEIVQQAAPKEFDKLDDWFSNKLVSQADKISLPNSAENIHKEVIAVKPLIEKFLKHGVKIKSPYTAPVVIGTSRPLCNGILVREICITGTLTQPRDYYERLIKKKGILWATSVRSTTSHLVVADPSKQTTKTKKAHSYGTMIIGEKELNKILGI